MYRIFTRKWWKDNPAWPNGLEPDPCARKTTLGWCSSEEEAREFCGDYNRTHSPGRYSRKAEYTKI